MKGYVIGLLYMDNWDWYEKYFPATAKLILNARKIGAWHLFDESLDRLKDATPQNILIEKELAHHIRWTISKLVPEVFGDKSCPNVHLSGEKIEVVWAGTTNT